MKPSTSHTRPARGLGVCLLILTLVTLAPAPAQAAPPSRSDLASYADRILSEAFPATEPGAAVLVVQGGEVVIRKGYGLAEMELGVPVEPEMVFEIGSVTKQITAAAILLLVEQGKIRLEEDFRTYLTDYPANGQTITVEHLLTHTSGIPSYTGMQEWAARMREDFGLSKGKP